MIENGKINAGIQRSAVEAIVEVFRDDRFFKFEHVHQTLTRLIFFMKKWPNPHFRIYDACMERDDPIDTTELAMSRYDNRFG